MRYAFVSDIHSNLEALDAVLTCLRREAIDRYFHVGDIVGYGADPAACIAKIRALDCIGVGGNHDWACVEKTSAADFNPMAREAVLWTQGVLNAEQLQFLKSLQPVYTCEDLALVHGSLDEPDAFHYILNASGAMETLRLMRTRLCCIGHSHAPMIASLDPKGKLYFHRDAKVAMAEEGYRYLVNVGSVGQPRDGDPRAAYAIYDTKDSTVEVKRVAYDIPTAQRKIVQAGLPPVLAARLSEGW
ncbi:MAG: metallophosphoesterase family protein [Candidatus Omnitrophota bacterium]